MAIAHSFYANVCRYLASEISKTASYIAKQNPDCNFLNNVLVDEVVNIINAKKISSPGWDAIHSKIKKDTVLLYIEQLVYIFK